MSDRMHFWGHFVALVATWAVLRGVFCRFFPQNVEKQGFVNSTPVSNRMHFYGVRATKSEPGRAKRRIKWRPAKQIRRSGSKSVADRFCLAVGAMETIANHRESAATQVESEVKVYLSDKSYD